MTTTNIGNVTRRIAPEDYHKYSDSAEWPPEAFLCIAENLEDPYYEVDKKKIDQFYSENAGKIIDPQNCPEILVGWYPQHYLDQDRQHPHLLHLMSWRFHALFNKFLDEKIEEESISGRPHFYAHKVDADYIELLVVCKEEADTMQISMMWPAYFQENKEM